MPAGHCNCRAGQISLLITHDKACSSSGSGAYSVTFRTCLVCPITNKVVGAPPMSFQQFLSTQSCLQLPLFCLRNPSLTMPLSCLSISSSVYLSFLPSLCSLILSLLSQKTLVFISCSRSGVRHIFQWLLGSFCEQPHKYLIVGRCCIVRGW